jgi:hypothetical protein
MRILTTPAAIAATTAMLFVSTAAVARPGDRYRGHDGIDAGDVIAGALIIGGIAAIASAASNNRNDRYDRGYGYRDNDYRGWDYRNGRGYGDNGYYQNGYGSRTAVDQCVRAAQIEARRYGNARVTDVTRIDRIRGGYEVRGRLIVQDRGWNGWRGNRGGWDRGNQYGRYNEGYERGRFSCVTRRGSVDDVRLSGLTY